MDGIEANCPHCHRRFVVRRSLKGGVASCPECNKAVPVPGGPEPLFWVLVGLGAAVILGLFASCGGVNPARGARLIFEEQLTDQIKAQIILEDRDLLTTEDDAEDDYYSGY